MFTIRFVGFLVVGCNFVNLLLAFDVASGLMICLGTGFDLPVLVAYLGWFVLFLLLEVGWLLVWLLGVREF